MWSFYTGIGGCFAPVFDNRDLAGYKPPEWYASGSLVSCVAQIDARFKRSWRARGLAATLKWLEHALPGPLALHASSLILTSPPVLLRKVLEKIAGSAAASRRLPQIVKKVGRPPYRVSFRPSQPLRLRLQERERRWRALWAWPRRRGISKVPVSWRNMPSSFPTGPTS